MGGGSSKVAAAAEGSADLRLTIKELEAAAKEKAVSLWWLESNRFKKLFEMFDSDKNGTLDAQECARAIRELAKLADYLFGSYVDLDTARQLDDFEAALKMAGAGADGALAAAVPLDVRATELKSVLSALARLETRAGFAETQAATLRGKIESGFQTARGVNMLREQLEPLQAAAADAKAALPRLEERYLKQHNAACCLLAQPLVATVDGHEAVYESIASSEADAIAAIAETASKVEALFAKHAMTSGGASAILHHDQPAAAAAFTVDRFGAYEAQLPAAADDVRGQLVHSHSLKAAAAAATPTPATSLETLLLLLSTATRHASAPLRALAEQALLYANAEAEKIVVATATPTPPAASGGKKAKAPKAPKKSLSKSYSAANLASVRDVVEGPIVQDTASCCAAAHEAHGGDFTRLLDLLTVGISFESCAILHTALDWLCDADKNGGSFEALQIDNQLTHLWEPELSGGARRVKLYGWLLLSAPPLAGVARRGNPTATPPPTRFFVRVDLQLRRLAQVSKAALPHATAVLDALDATIPPFGTSHDPLGKANFDRVYAGATRRLQANRLSIEAKESHWAHGNVMADVGALLSSDAAKTHLLQLSMTRDVKVPSSGHYLERLLGATYQGSGQVLVCTRLQVLQLGRNGLKGKIPEAIAMCKKLTRLELHENELEEKLPENLTSALTELIVLRLNGNQITGELPQRWACSRLAVLDVSHNNLTGPLPKAVVALPALESLDVSHCRFNDHLPSGGDSGTPAWKCSKLKTLRVDHNRLSGEIPREVFEVCTELEVGLFSNNTLSGEIPKSVRAAVNLVELDLHTNFFKGYVPCTQLKECVKLKMLNLMHQVGDEALLVMIDDGSKAALIAALPECHIMWPGDENASEAAHERDAKFAKLKTEKESAERRRQNAFEKAKENQEIADKADASLKELLAHVEKTKAKAEEARVAQKEAFEAFLKSRAAEAEATAAFHKFEQAIHGVNSR